MKDDWLLCAVAPALALGWVLLLLHLRRRKMYGRKRIAVLALVATIAVLAIEALLVFFLMLSHVCN